MTSYRAKDGDTLDWICWHRYGTEAVVPQVLEANPGLADLGPRLPAGTLVMLPDVGGAEKEEKKGVTGLW